MIRYTYSDLTRAPRKPGPDRWIHPVLLPSNWEVGPPAHTGDLRYLGDAETDAAFRDDDEWRRTVYLMDTVLVVIDMARAGEFNRGLLDRVSAMCQRYGRRIALQVGATYGVATSLDTAAECVARDLEGIVAIEAAGGVVTYLDCDHPTRRAMDGLGITLTEACEMFAEYMALMHDERPDLLIGYTDQPPNWDMAGKPTRTGASYGVEYEDGWDALMTAIAAESEQLAFVHLDDGFPYPHFGAVIPSFTDVDNWALRTEACRVLAAAEGIPTGLWITGSVGGGGVNGTFPGAPAAGSNELFVRESAICGEMARLRMGAFDRMVYGSFFYYPRDLAPDSMPGTFADGFWQALAAYQSG